MSNSIKEELAKIFGVKLSSAKDLREYGLVDERGYSVVLPEQLEALELYIAKRERMARIDELKMLPQDTISARSAQGGGYWVTSERTAGSIVAKRLAELETNKESE